MKSPTAIPKLVAGDQQLIGFAAAVKDSLDRMTAQQKGATKLNQLPADASLDEIIKTVNVLIARLGQ